MILFLKKRWVYHSLIWLLLVLFLGFILWRNGEFTSDDRFWGSLISIILSLFASVYLAFYFKNRFFDRRQYGWFLLSLLLTVSIGVAIIEGLFFLLGNTSSLAQNIQNVSFIILIAIGLQYFKRGIINQYQLQELRAEKAITELQVLKAQINPHFLFNTLNNIYGINQNNSKRGSEMIMELSDVMRYHLEFSKHGKVRLEDEIQLLQSYIKLERLRLRDNCEVEIDFETADRSIMISPLLFIPFVENAFKHGTHPTKDCFVNIQLTTTPRELSFTVKNSLIRNRKVVKTHIGLQNTKRRLELLFPQKHQLNITKNESYHLVDLRIEL